MERVGIGFEALPIVTFLSLYVRRASQNPQKVARSGSAIRHSSHATTSERADGAPGQN